MIPPLRADLDGDLPEESLSEVFHLVEPARRRRLIWCLAGLEPHETITVRELAKEVEAAKQDVSPSEIPNEDYRSTYTNSVSHHLPKLASVNAIEYDSDRQTVSPAPNLVALAAVISISAPIVALLASEEIK